MFRYNYTERLCYSLMYIMNNYHLHSFCQRTTLYTDNDIPRCLWRHCYKGLHSGKAVNRRGKSVLKVEKRTFDHEHFELWKWFSRRPRY